MVLPLGVLNAAQGAPMLVELKNGETLNGTLATCDTFMNLILKEVVQTNAEGSHFMKLAEVYVRGNNIKYLRIPEEVLDKSVAEQDRANGQRGRGGARGDFGGRGDRGGRGGRGGPRGRGGRGRAS